MENYEYEENTPAFVIWNDSEKMIAVGPIKDSQRTSEGYILQYDDLGCIELEEEVDYLVYREDVNPTIAHIIHREYDEIYNRLSEKK